MNQPDYTYEGNLLTIMQNGVDRGDRTGTGTRGLFGIQMRWSLDYGFPLVTTKRVYTRPMVEELLWMLSGSTNNNDLVAKDVHIWDEWAREDGSLGPIYGKQWRSWNGIAFGQGTHSIGGIDQIFALVDGIQKDPSSRRHIVSAWNVSDLKHMALAPCHCLFQFYVADGRLSCQLYQRSADMFLGVPFNIASYALLTHMVAQQCDLGVGEFIWTGGDCHIYQNHFDQVRLQLSRQPKSMPTLRLSRARSIFDYQLSDVEFLDYEYHPAIQAPVSV
jgi:thymidylate synthase